MKRSLCYRGERRREVVGPVLARLFLLSPSSRPWSVVIVVCKCVGTFSFALAVAITAPSPSTGCAEKLWRYLVIFALCVVR